MDSKDITKKENEKVNQIKLENKFGKIRSKYILQKIFNNINKIKLLKFIRINKNIQKRLNIDINNFREYSEIEIEIIPFQNEYENFININNKKDEKYYHIYFDDNKKDIKRTYLNKGDIISKIKIIIDYQINSFNRLFKNCNCIKSILFKRFYRKNIIDLSFMFYKCSSLKELNLSNFNTDNVTNMSAMFYECSSLKELNLSNFNTNKVKTMNLMFGKCSKIEKLNLSNFNTNNVTDMRSMFSNCSSLEELNLSNFNTDKVIDMCFMFYQCSSLKKLNLSNFNTSNIKYMRRMFSNCYQLEELNISNFNINETALIDGMFDQCSYEFIEKIKTKFKNLKEKSF